MLPLSTVLGLFVAVPMSDDRTPRTLEGALQDTIQTLEVLRGYRSADAIDAVPDVELVRRATEPAIGDPSERTARLATLSDDMQRLHTHLELLRSGALPANAPLAQSDFHLDVPTVGLAAGELERLLQNSRKPYITLDDPSPRGSNSASSSPPSTQQAPVATPSADDAAGAAPSGPPPTAETDSAAAEKARDEAADFAFNRARAAYFAGQYDRALADFEAGPDEPRSRYWRARSLEQLGRLDEALTLYDSVVADPTSGDLVERAKGDADFLRWKIDFEKGSSSR
ncbi:tetratricopeptide repeat protein [Rohdeia mirabilis]